MASPLEIMIALHYWTTPCEYAADDERHRTSGAVTDILESYVRAGFLEKLPEANKYGGTFKSTDALGVWVDALCSIPFPVQKWVIPDSAREQPRK